MGIRKILMVIAAFAVIATAASVPRAISSSASTVPLLGSYNGAANPAGASSFANETGTTASIYSDYLDGSSWGSMVGSAGSPPWVISQIKGKLGGMRLLLSVPLVNAGYSSDQAALAAYAANPSSWEANFTTLAQNLVSAGFSNAVIRLMWEPDSGIYSNEDLTSAANYATLWRDAHSAMAAASGANFQWAWYWGGNFDATTNNTAYPGDAYVDYVTFDDYDQSWDGSCGVPFNGSNFTQAQHNCLWAGDQSRILASLVSFASAHAKPIGIGEFGVINRSDGHGGGDDPYWVNDFSAWMKSNNVAWASYFNFNSGGNSILSDYPNSLSAFKADLGPGASPPPPPTTTTTAPAPTTTTTAPAPTTTTTRPPPPPTTTTTTRPPPSTTTTTAPPSTTTTTTAPPPPAGPPPGSLTITALQTSEMSATTGKESSMVFKVTVTPAVNDTVTVYADGGLVQLCQVTVTTAKGSGSCALSDSELGPGVYVADAVTPSGADFVGSFSNFAAFTIDAP